MDTSTPTRRMAPPKRRIVRTESLAELLPDTPGWPRSFQELYCQFFRCSPKAYPRRVFWYALCRKALPAAATIYCLHPRFFARDFLTIHKIGSARSAREFQHLLNMFHRLELGSIRTKWHLRISGHRLMNLMKEVTAVEGLSDHNPVVRP